MPPKARRAEQRFGEDTRQTDPHAALTLLVLLRCGQPRPVFVLPSMIAGIATPENRMQYVRPQR